MNDYKSIIDRIVVAGASREAGGYDDWVDLSGVISAVREVVSSEHGDLIDITLHVVRELLSNDLAVVGTLSPDMTAFDPWASSIPDSLARIEREWRALKREPKLWEICWFENTPLGNERARTTA